MEMGLTVGALAAQQQRYEAAARVQVGWGAGSASGCQR